MTLIIIIITLSVLLVLGGVAYDFFVRKSFKEAEKGPVNQNAEQAKTNANINTTSNFNGFDQ